MRKDDVSNLLAQDIPPMFARYYKIDRCSVIPPSKILGYEERGVFRWSNPRHASVLWSYEVDDGQVVVQLQNLPRNYLEDLDTARKFLRVEM